MGEVAVIEYRDEDTGTVFRWHGGAYIDVGYYSEVAQYRNMDRVDGFFATDVINVWDDEADVSYLEEMAAGSRRPFRTILELFEARCRKYLADQPQEQDA